MLTTARIEFRIHRFEILVTVLACLVVAITAAIVSVHLVQATATVNVTCVLPSGSSCTFASAQAGDSVNVTVHYPYKSFFPFLFGSSFDLSSTVQMVIEQ